MTAACYTLDALIGQFHDRPVRDVAKSSAEDQAYSALTDSRQVGTLVLDGRGGVLWANHLAHDLLDEQDGIFVDRGLLDTKCPSARSQLQQFMHKLVSTPAGEPVAARAMVLARPSGRKAFEFMLQAIRSESHANGPDDPAALAFIRDPEKVQRPSFELVQQLFNLTPTEARLALLLADGLSLDEIIENIAISRNTARAYLRSIFAKTGVRRQSALVSLLLRSVAFLR